MNEPRNSTTSARVGSDERAGSVSDGRTQLADRVRSLKLPADIAARRRGPVFWLPWILVVGLAGVMVAQQFLPSRKAASDRDDKLKVGDSTEEVASDGVALEAGGYVVPVKTVQVTPKVGGRVLKLYIVKEGQYFNEGDLLAELETDEYKFDLDRAKASLAEAQAAEQQMLAKYNELKAGGRPEEVRHSEAMIAEAEEILRQLKAEEQRLIKAGPSTPADELEKVQSRRIQAKHRLDQLREQGEMVKKNRQERIDAAKAEYDVARQRVAQAQAEFDKAKYRYDNCKVVSPVSGVVLRKQVEEGSTVQPQAISSSLSPSMCEMADLRQMEIEIDISERDLKRVHLGQKCHVFTEAYPDVRYEGVLAQMMPVAIRSKASVQVKVAVRLPDFSWFQAMPMLSGAAAAEPASVFLNVQMLSAWSQGKLFVADPFLRPDMRARVRFLTPEGPPPAQR